MYFQKNQRFSRNNRQKRSARPVKIFDPSHLVNQAVAIQPQAPYQNRHQFSDFKISSVILNNIKSHGYVTPTPIQDQVIELILQQRDVIGIANTGTGKTAAFLIPLVENISRAKAHKALIITPTRELAVQIKSELQWITQGIGIRSALAIGGTNMERQKINLRQNPHFVIATPGRLDDLVRQKAVQLTQFDVIVLDEVDQMVDIGFIEVIKYFIAHLSRQRQSLFFTATIDQRVKEILAEFVQNPVTVSVKQQDLLHNIRHQVVRINNQSQKIEELHDLLNKKDFAKVLIFGRTKWGMQKLSDELVKRGFNANVIHGNKSQNQRLRVLDQFKQDRINILLATDVASRGLDIGGVTHVINFDPPESYETYIHRIGRTGRANKPGTALTFI